MYSYSLFRLQRLGFQPNLSTNWYAATIYSAEVLSLLLSCFCCLYSLHCFCCLFCLYCFCYLTVWFFTSTTAQTILCFYCFIHSHASVHSFPLTPPLRLPPRLLWLPLHCASSLTLWGYVDSLDWSKRSMENTSSRFTVTVLLLEMIATYTKFFQLNGGVLSRSQS